MLRASTALPVVVFVDMSPCVVSFPDLITDAYVVASVAQNTPEMLFNFCPSVNTISFATIINVHVTHHLL